MSRLMIGGNNGLVTVSCPLLFLDCIKAMFTTSQVTELNVCQRYVSIHEQQKKCANCWCNWRELVVFASQSELLLIPTICGYARSENKTHQNNQPVVSSTATRCNYLFVISLPWLLEDYCNQSLGGSGHIREHGTAGPFHVMVGSSFPGAWLPPVN